MSVVQRAMCSVCIITRWHAFLVEKALIDLHESKTLKLCKETKLARRPIMTKMVAVDPVRSAQLVGEIVAQIIFMFSMFVGTTPCPYSLGDFHDHFVKRRLTQILIILEMLHLYHIILRNPKFPRTHVFVLWWQISNQIHDLYRASKFVDTPLHDCSSANTS